MPVATRNSSKRSASRKRWATYGPLAAAWIEASLIHGEGDLFGKPFRLTADQRQFIDKLLEYDAKTGRMRYRRAVLGRAKGWGKTEFIAAVGLFLLAGPLAPTAPNIPIAAASFEQADLLFGSARVMASKPSPLAPFVEAYDTEILRQDGPGRMYRIAAAAGTNDGSRPSAFLADELHEWTGNKARVFLVVTNSISKRQDGLVVVLSTAGGPDSELLRQLYDYGRQVQAGLIDDDEFLLDWCEADATLDPNDGPEVRRLMAMQANPHAEQFGTLSSVERRWHEIPEHEWRRYFANQWVEHLADCWLPSGAWAACEDRSVEFDTARPFKASLDFAQKHDNAAIVMGQHTPDGRIVVRSKVWAPGKDRPIDTEEVERYIRSLHATGNLTSFHYDPAMFRRSAELLEQDGVPMIEFPQSAQRMVPAAQFSYQQILAGKVVHDGDPVLADHVLGAVPKTAGDGWRIDKRSKRPNDACISLVMTLYEVGALDDAVPFFAY